MPEELITDLIDEPRITKQLNDTIAGLGVVKDKILEINNLGKGITLGDDGIENFKRAKTAAEQLAAAEMKLAAANTDLAKEIAKVRVQTEETNKSNKAAARESLGLVDAYKKLSNQFIEAARTAKNLAAIDLAKGLKDFSKETKNAMTYANGLNDQLKAIDAGVGQYQRNVGNYASATFALNQVLREAPALAINFQTFALAISNNLPILFDEFSKLSKAIDENTGKVNGARRALKILGSSLFGMQTFLTLGITLFTLYSKEISTFFSNLFKGEKSIDAIKEAHESLNKTMREGVKDAQDEIVAMRRLFAVASDSTQPMEARKQAIKDIKKEWPQYAKDLKDEAFLTGQATEAYDKIVVSLTNVARTKAVLSRVSENYAKDLDLEAERAKVQLELDAEIAKNREGQSERFIKYTKEKGIYLGNEYNLTKRLQEIDEERAKIFTENALLERKASKDTTDLTKKYYEDLDKNQGKLDKKNQDRIKARLEGERTALEQQAETQKAIFEDETVGYIQRVRALDEFHYLQQGIAQKNREIGLLGAKKEKEEIFKVDAQYRKDIEKAYIDHQGTMIDITESFLDENDKVIVNAAKKRQDQLSKDEATERKTLLDHYQQGRLITEEYEAERLRIENKYAILRLKNEAEALTVILKERQDYNVDFLQVQERLLEVQNKIRELDIQYQEKAEIEKNKISERAAKQRAKQTKKEYEELAKQIQQAIRQFNDIAGPILDIISNKYETQKNAIQDQINLIDEREKREIEAVSKSTASEQEKADRIAVIQAQAESQRKALEAERRRVQEQQARFDKAKAIFDIVASTAVNVVKFLGVPVLAALAAAVGAAQLAAVASRPIPKYKGGRKGGPAEFAYVGDGGVSEVVEHDGKMWVTPRRSTLTYLPAGATVHSSTGEFLQKHGISAHQGLSLEPGNVYGLSMVQELKKGNRRIVEAIRGNRSHSYEPLYKEDVRSIVDSVMSNYTNVQKYKR